MLLALAELEADTCPGCGNRLSESAWRDDRQDPRFDVGALRCLGCEALHKGQEKLHDREEKKPKGSRLPETALRWWSTIIHRRPS